eukprot:6207286-Pleurochrysis_carterae.AAC.1
MPAEVFVSAGPTDDSEICGVFLHRRLEAFVQTVDRVCTSSRQSTFLADPGLADAAAHLARRCPPSEPRLAICVRARPGAAPAARPAAPMAATRLHWLCLLLLLLREASVARASLQPCGSRATFHVTADGGTNFAGEVRVSRWQPDRQVQLQWGANSVSVRAESIAPAKAATLLTSASGSAAQHTFRLGAHGGSPTGGEAAGRQPPGLFSFRADGLPSQPRVLCDLADLPAYPPAPPPAPLRCAASLIWRNDKKWTGGFSASLQVGGEGVPAHFVIRADFHTRATIGLLSADGAREVETADSAPGVMLLRPTLTGGKGTIELRVRGEQGSPSLSCEAEPPSPPPPPMACGLGASWQLTETLKEGSKYIGTVSLDEWRAGSTVSVDFGAAHEVLSVSSVVTQLQAGAHAEHGVCARTRSM